MQVWGNAPPQKIICLFMLDAWFQKIILLVYDIFVAAIVSQSLLIKYYITRKTLSNSNFMLFFWIDEVVKS